MRTTLYFLLLCLLPIRASLAGITISESVVSEDETSVWIDAQFSYQIDEQVVEAIKNGIPLVFRAEYRIEEVRPLWEENLIIERIEHRFILSYREFTNRYYLISLQNNSHGTYDTLQTALERIERRHSALKIEKSRLNRHHSTYQARIRASLDESTLPELIRPYLYAPLFWPEWKLDSGWHAIPIKLQD